MESLGFFEEIFLLADININIVFEILFFNWSNIIDDFYDWKLK